MLVNIVSSSLVFCPRVGPSLQTQVPRLQFCPKAGFPLQTQEPRLQFYQGWRGEISSRCFPHPTLSLVSQQNLKDPRGTNEEVRRVDLANWALRTSHGISPQGLNISSIGVFDQIRDQEIPITLRPHWETYFWVKTRNYRRMDKLT